MALHIKFNQNPMDSDGPVKDVGTYFVVDQQADSDSKLGQFRKDNGIESSIFQGTNQGILSDRCGQQFGTEGSNASTQLIILAFSVLPSNKEGAFNRSIGQLVCKGWNCRRTFATMLSRILEGIDQDIKTVVAHGWNCLQQLSRSTVFECGVVRDIWILRAVMVVMVVPKEKNRSKCPG